MNYPLNIFQLKCISANLPCRLVTNDCIDSSSQFTETKLMMFHKIFMVIKVCFLLPFYFYPSPGLQYLDKTFHLIADSFIILTRAYCVALEFVLN